MQFFDGDINDYHSIGGKLAKKGDEDISVNPKVSMEISLALSTILSRDSGYIHEEDLLCLFVSSFMNLIEGKVEKRLDLEWKMALRGFSSSIGGLDDSVTGEKRIIFYANILRRNAYFSELFKITQKIMGDFKIVIALTDCIDVGDLSLHTVFLLEELSRREKHIRFYFAGGGFINPVERATNSLDF